MKFFKTNLFF